MRWRGLFECFRSGNIHHYRNGEETSSKMFPYEESGPFLSWLFLNALPVSSQGLTSCPMSCVGRGCFGRDSRAHARRKCVSGPRERPLVLGCDTWGHRRGNDSPSSRPDDRSGSKTAATESSVGGLCSFPPRTVCDPLARGRSVSTLSALRQAMSLTRFFGGEYVASHALRRLWSSPTEPGTSS